MSCDLAEKHPLGLRSQVDTSLTPVPRFRVPQYSSQPELVDRQRNSRVSRSGYYTAPRPTRLRTARSRVASLQRTIRSIPAGLNGTSGAISEVFAPTTVATTTSPRWPGLLPSESHGHAGRSTPFFSKW